MLVADDTRTRIERMVKADPAMKAAEIGRALDLSRQRVQQYLDEMGYFMDCRWQKRKPPK